VLVAPLIILKVPGFPGAGIEQNAPQALTYGWVLQFGYALLPYILARALLHGTAYAFWLVSLVPILVQLWQIFRAGQVQFESATTAPELAE